MTDFFAKLTKICPVRPGPCKSNIKQKLGTLIKKETIFKHNFFLKKKEKKKKCHQVTIVFSFVIKKSYDHIMTKNIFGS